MHPLSTVRYVELVDRLNGSFGLIKKYLELRIKLMQMELDQKKMNKQQEDDRVTYT